MHEGILISFLQFIRNLLFLMISLCLFAIPSTLLAQDKIPDIHSELDQSIDKINQPVDSALLIVAEVVDSVEAITSYPKEVEKAIHDLGKRYETLLKDTLNSLKNPVKRFDKKVKDLSNNTEGINIELPELSKGLPDANDLGSLPAIESFTDELKLDVFDDLKDYQEYADLQNLLDKYAADLPMDELKKLTDTKSLKTTLEDYSKNLDKKIEKEVLKLPEVMSFKKEIAAFETVKKIPKRYKDDAEAYMNRVKKYSDKEYLKKDGLEQATKEAVRHFAKKSALLKSAQKEMAKYKKKYSSINSFKNKEGMVKRNSMKGKGLGKRLVLGGNFQLIPSETFELDISPVLGYKINKRFVVATGATYRATFSTGNEWARELFNTDVYGYRAFLEYDIIKGFYTHGEYENMNNTITVKINNTTYRQWSAGLLMGIGKHFSVSKTLQGNTAILYNALRTEGSPYPSRWVFRFGFDVKMDRPKTKTKL